MRHTAIATHRRRVFGMNGFMLGKAHAHVLMLGEISDQHTTLITNNLVVMVIYTVVVRERMVDDFPICPRSFNKMPLMKLGLAVIAINDQRVGPRSIIEIVINAG